jgi:hypothetical protein
MASTLYFNDRTEKFLIKNKIKTRFVNNTKRGKSETELNKFIERAKLLSPRDVIAHAFTWIEDPEYHLNPNFWLYMCNRAKRWEEEGKI